MHQDFVTDALSTFRALIEVTAPSQGFTEYEETSTSHSAMVEQTYRLPGGHLELAILFPRTRRKYTVYQWELEIHFTGQSYLCTPSLSLFRGRGGSKRFTDAGWPPLIASCPNKSFHDFLTNNPFWRKYFSQEEDRTLTLDRAIELVLAYHEAYRTDRAQLSLFGR